MKFKTGNMNEATLRQDPLFKEIEKGLENIPIDEAKRVSNQRYLGRLSYQYELKVGGVECDIYTDSEGHVIYVAVNDEVLDKIEKSDTVVEMTAKKLAREIRRISQRKTVKIKTGDMKKIVTSMMKSNTEEEKAEISLLEDRLASLTSGSGKYLATDGAGAYLSEDGSMTKDNLMVKIFNSADEVPQNYKKVRI